MSDSESNSSGDESDGFIDTSLATVDTSLATVDTSLATVDQVSSAWIKHHNACLIELDNPHHIAHMMCTTDWYPRRDVLYLFCRMSCVKRVESREQLERAIRIWYQLHGPLDYFQRQRIDAKEPVDFMTPEQLWPLLLETHTLSQDAMRSEIISAKPAQEWIEFMPTLDGQDRMSLAHWLIDTMYEWSDALWAQLVALVPCPLYLDLKKMPISVWIRPIQPMFSGDNSLALCLEKEIEPTLYNLFAITREPFRWEMIHDVWRAGHRWPIATAQTYQYCTRWVSREEGYRQLLQLTREEAMQIRWFIPKEHLIAWIDIVGSMATRPKVDEESKTVGRRRRLLLLME